MSNPLPSVTPANPTAIPVDSSSGLWDRVSSWVSENKAVVYTIAGVAVVVTGAGAVYYLTSDAVRLLSTKCRLLIQPTKWLFLSISWRRNAHANNAEIERRL